jgi:uncharacterized ion transporter superfamily protein YfcC
MKKFFEKHDLFKMSMIVLLLAVLFSWIMPYTFFDGSNFTNQDVTRVGLFDLSTYSMLGFYYFTTFFIFVFVVAGFYKFLGNIPGYQVMTDKIATVFKGKEKVLAVLSIVIYAVITSITTNYMAPLALIPLSLTVFSKLKVDKVTGVASTIGGMLIGILCSTYSTQVVGMIVNGFKLDYVFELVPIILLAVVAIGLLSFFVIKKIDNTDKDNLLEDVFAPKTTKAQKASAVPVAIVLAVVLIATVLAFIGWSDVFKVTLFTDWMTSIKDAEVFGFKLFGSLLGENAQPFGAWDGFTVAGLMFIATLILQIVYRVPADTVIDSYSAGFKKINKTVVILLVVYAILIVSVVFPTIPYIISGITKLGSNVFTWFLESVLVSIFGIDMQYVITLGGTYLATVGNNSVAALALQTGYGLVQFISPTSVVLVFVLSLIDVKFKDYFKFIWKFLLALLVVVLIVLAVVAYV